MRRTSHLLEEEILKKGTRRVFRRLVALNHDVKFYRWSRFRGWWNIGLVRKS